MGRSFLPADRGTPAVILTDSAFQRRFGGDPTVVGKSLPTKDGEATVVGILPPGLQLQFAPDAHIPADLELFEPFANNLPKMTGRFLRIVGRLKPGVSMVEAQRDLDRIAGEIRAALPLQDKDFQMRMAGLQADAFADVAPALKVLFGG